MIHFVYFVTFLSYHLSCKVERVELKYTKKKKETKIRCASDFAVNYPLKPLIIEEYEEFNFSSFNNQRSFLVYAIKPASSQVFLLKNVKPEAFRAVWIVCILTILSSIWVTLPWYLWCFPTSVNGFCNLYLIAIYNWVSKVMQDWIGFLFLFSDWSRKIAPPPLSFKCKNTGFNRVLVLSVFPHFSQVSCFYSEFPFPLCDIFLCLD